MTIKCIKYVIGTSFVLVTLTDDTVLRIEVSKRGLKGKRTNQRDLAASIAGVLRAYSPEAQV